MSTFASVPTSISASSSGSLLAPTQLQQPNSITPEQIAQLDGPSQTVLMAVQTLLHDMDAGAKKRANEWLSEFQHTTEAWQTCHSLLSNPLIPVEAHLIASQTIRQKTLYDLSQLPSTSLLPLRDSFLSLLTTFSAPAAPSGSRAIVKQLCLILADLAYSIEEWQGVVEGMIEGYGKDEGRVMVLLEFLRCLVEESMNSRLSVPAAQMGARCEALLSSQSERVLQTLSMYIQAPGVTPKIQTAVFETLRSWLQEGEMAASSVLQTPLFGYAFDALASDELFDSAVDVICDLIHETQEVEDNVGVIQEIVPRVLALRASFDRAREDEVDDRVRGFCRIFTEAGETYRQLILQHPDTFVPLVQVIGQCADYHDLDIVPITFNFWYKLSQALGKRPQDGGLSTPTFAPFLEVYAQLQDSMVKHLQFPSDGETQSAMERDEFRAFRHQMGDTLKDCCQVLGAGVCMKRSYDLVMTALAKGQAMVWQEVEAPLFSMRSMGAEVDPTDDEILPHIMDMLPTLPPHPKIQYAAILVISRYTQWIDLHPTYLEFQLNYISAGFQVKQDDVSAAAAQAMKFMCEDCRRHLVPYLPQLYSFITTAGLALPIEDRLEVSEAIGHVISSMAGPEAALALQKFTQPLLATIQAVAMEQRTVSKDELVPVLHVLEQLETYLSVVKTIDPYPQSCSGTATAVYGVLDLLLSKYYASYSITDKTCRLIRRGMSFFPFSEIQSVLPQVLARLTECFEQSGHSSYLWIEGKVVSLFAEQVASLGPAGEGLISAFAVCLERATATVDQMEKAQGVTAMPDVIDDFVRLFEAYRRYFPAVLFSSTAFPTAFALMLAALELPSPEIIFTTLESIEDLLKLPSKKPEFAPFVLNLANAHGARLTALALHGLVQNYPEDSMDAIVEIVRELSRACSGEMLTWVGQALESLPGHAMPAADKQTTLTTFQQAFAAGDLDKVKTAIVGYYRSARRARDRKGRLSVAGNGRDGR